MRKIISLLLMLSIIMMNNIFIFAETNESEVETEENYVSTMVFLRYTNEVPDNILQSFAQEGFGPAGTSNNPYFIVEVDLNKIESLCEQGFIKKYTSGEYVYYSAQDTLDQLVVKDEAVSCWNSILQAVSDTDKQKFDEYFGTSNFIGYVFKLEADGWHIDGILNVKPGYITEFYLNGEIKSTDVALAAMSIETAKENIEEILGVSSNAINWNEEGMNGTYKIGDENYQFIIEEGDYSPLNENVQYETKIQDGYYLARIYINTEKIEQKPAPPVESEVPPTVPEPIIPPVIPEPVVPIEPIEPTIPIEPQPLPPDDPLIEEPEKPVINPQPLPPDDPLIEEEPKQQLFKNKNKALKNLGFPKTSDEAPLIALIGLFLLSAGVLSIICTKEE